MILERRCRMPALLPVILFLCFVSGATQSFGQRPTATKIYSSILTTIEKLKADGITPQNARYMNVASRFNTLLHQFDELGRIGLHLDVFRVSPGLISKLQAFGGNVLLALERERLITVYLPFDKIEDVASLEEVRIIRPITGGVTNEGSVVTEGDVVHHAVKVRSDLGVKGDSINVGVISDGCASWAMSLGSGDLPATFGPPNFTFSVGPKSGAGDEGTAMMEIIHDLAPNAALYFYGALHDAKGSAAHVEAIQVLVREKHCRIIVDDLTWFDQPMFEDGTPATTGTVAAAAKWANDTGVVYISSAGNWADGPPDILSRSHYQAMYNDNNPGQNNNAKPIPPPNTPPWNVPAIPPASPVPLAMWPYRDLHNFNPVAGGPIDPGLMVTVPGFHPPLESEPTTLQVILEWADPPGLPNDPDPWGSSADDYDLYLYDAGFMHQITASITVQNGHQNPYEYLSWQNYSSNDSAVNIVINHLDTIPPHHPPKLLGLYISGCQWAEYFTPQNSIWGQPGIPEVIATGAVPFNNIGAIEPFSSHGNYDVYVPGYVSREKPDVVGVDGVTVSGTGGTFPPPFFGTSAAAPHIAGLAALLLSACPQLTPAQVHAKFERTAIPDGGPGFNAAFGNGFLDIERSMLELNTSPGLYGPLTQQSTLNAPMFFVTQDAYALSTTTVTGGLQQPNSVTTSVTVTAGNPYTSAGVRDPGCPTVKRWYTLSQNGGTNGGFNADITAYVDESERSAAGIDTGNLSILHWNGSFFDLLPSASARVGNTWKVKATFAPASLSPFFVGYLSKGLDVATISNNSGRADTTVAVVFTMRNTGNGWDTLSFHCRDTKGWTITPTDSALSLTTGQLVNITVFVTVSHGDTVGTVDTVWLAGASVSNHAIKDSSSATVRKTTGEVTITLHLKDGWNMVSVPLHMADCCVSSLFPGAASRAFGYEYHYSTEDTLVHCLGYWVKYSGSHDITLTGYTCEHDSIKIRSGWNMIGSINIPLADTDITSSPGGIVTSKIFAFNGSSYIIADSIFPGYGYWIKAISGGTLYLNRLRGPGTALRIVMTAAGDMPPPPPTGEMPPLYRETPGEYGLDQNYPEPFNPSTVIRYQLPAESRVTLTVYNVLGNAIARLVDEIQPAGYRSVVWNGTGCASGIYFYKLQARSTTASRQSIDQVRKMLLVK